MYIKMFWNVQLITFEFRKTTFVNEFQSLSRVYLYNDNPCKTTILYKLIKSSTASKLR